MAIHYETTIQDDLLRVKAWGFDESPEDTAEYSLALLNIAIEHQTRFVLSDERELEYRLSVLDTYQHAEMLANVVPRIASVAIVCHSQDYQGAEFFENVVVNRGLTLKIFTDLDEAEAWLMRSIQNTPTNNHQG